MNNDKDKDKDTSKNVLTHEGENKYIRQRQLIKGNNIIILYTYTQNTQLSQTITLTTS